jgi:hypothetical protein
VDTFCGANIVIDAGFVECPLVASFTVRFTP